MADLNNIKRSLRDYINSESGISEERVIELIRAELLNQVGDLNNLETNAKDLIVNAINEIVADLNVLENNIESAFQLGNDVKQKLVDALIARGIREEDISTSDTMTEIISRINWLGNFKQYYWYEFKVPSSNRTITLFGDARGDQSPEARYTDWGDGTIDKELSHTYAKAGVYNVKTKYVLRTKANTYDSNTVAALTNIFNVNNKANDWEKLFQGCTGLTVVDANNWDVSNTIYFHSMFKGCTNLVEFHNEKWEYGIIPNMYAMFDGCSKLNC